MFGKKKDIRPQGNLNKEMKAKQKNVKANTSNSAIATGNTMMDGYKPKKMSKFKEKLDMYDMIIANLIAGNSIIETEAPLDNSQLAIGFSNVSSATHLTKYFMITKFPDFLQPNLIDNIRNKCMRPGVRINFYFEGVPHRIDWDSQEMKSRMAVWRQYSKDANSGITDVFSYRAQRGESLAKQRIITSTKYLNEAELEYKRSFFKTIFIIEISAKRDEDSLANMAQSIKQLKTLGKSSDIKFYEIKVNMLDWLRAILPFSLHYEKEVNDKLSRRVLTDDLLANFNSYKQGHVGINGIPLGMDVESGGPVLRVFKEDPDAADNWLISAETGGGKSLWTKNLISYLLDINFTVTIMDYEGDEYNNIANYIKAGKSDDVVIISMGKGSAAYFDPCEIPELTGDPDVDNDLKSTATEFILSLFRLITCGEKEFSREQEKVMSLAIERMYSTAGVTEDKSTWHRSRGLNISMVYDEIKDMVESKELVDPDNDNLKHKAAVAIADAASIYFEPGESKSYIFRHPMHADEIYNAKLIIFSFGMKGADTSTIDPVLLGLKQLSVAYINIAISNYCKYVKHGFNLKVWEEFQRWGAIPASIPIIINTITGGRKRGDVNFIITNDLASLLDENSRLANSLSGNIQNYAIGKIKDSKLRDKFCRIYDQQDCKDALNKIAKASHQKRSAKAKFNNSRSKYAYAFCIILDDGKKAVVKADIPNALFNSKLYKTGVDVKDKH